MIRARFELKGMDPRPARWPISHPYWCTGYALGKRPIIVAYADSVSQVKSLWPDAKEQIEIDEVESYSFTDRFPKPDWLDTGECPNSSPEKGARNDL